MIDFKLKLKHILAFALLTLAIVIASIQPLEMEAYILHQIGTAFMLIVLLVFLYKIGLSFTTVCLYLGFLLIHVIGAHYLYSYVPYSEWTQALLGFNLDQSMGWTRNMYDRLVHLAFGLLLYPFFYRIFQIWLPQLKAGTLFLLVVQFVMATSLFYEWIEWLIAIGLSPEDAENYNGQQGDIWDAHKDMLLATLGAMITGGICLMTSNLLNNAKQKPEYFLS
ncbi:DUF2238 domain-containing protein [Acinetobacter sp. YH12097]|uniref:DUF2238 domain-containing protein n=1 Tax=Acinetobacter sp. YH12097 TaxID=2601086 RepID=UPI0015D329DC|nr:DUF2238 domain-containing protein [Acinetobacter sp. YH12097]